MRHMITQAVVLALLGTATGCTSYSDALGPPHDALRIEAVNPASGSVIPPGSQVTVKLRYRLPAGSTGSLTLTVTCSADADGFCCEEECRGETVARLTASEGTADVGFSIRAPASASVTVILRLLEDGTQAEVGAAVLSYSTAPSRPEH